MKKWIRFLLVCAMVLGMTMCVQAEEVQPEQQISTPVASIKQVEKGVRVSWDAIDGAEKYQVYRKVDNGKWSEEPFYETTTGDKCYYINVSVTVGKTYSYKVVAVTAEGSSEPSDVVTCTVKPAKVEGLIVERDTHESVKLEWNKVKGASGYQVYRSETGKKGSFKRVKTVKDADETTYVNRGLEISKTYYYKVRATKDSVKGTYSDVVSRKVALIPPEMKAISYVKKSSIQIRWNESASAQGYYVLRKKGTGSWKEIAKVKGSDVTSYTDKTAKASYQYAVRAYRVVNGKTYKSNRSYPVAARVLGTPTLTVKQADGEKKALLSWTKVKYAKTYRIYKKTGSGGSWKFVKSVPAEQLTYEATIPTRKTVYWKVRAAVTDETTHVPTHSYGGYSSEKSVIINQPVFIPYIDMIASAYPSNEAVENVLMGFINAGKSNIRIYSKDAYLYDVTDDAQYGRNLYLADADSGESIKYLDVAKMKGEIDESDIALPWFIVDGEATRLTEETEIQFIFRYDSMYYKAYVSSENVDFEEIEKPDWL